MSILLFPEKCTVILSLVPVHLLLLLFLLNVLFLYCYFKIVSADGGHFGYRTLPVHPFPHIELVHLALFSLLLICIIN